MIDIIEAQNKKDEELVILVLENQAYFACLIKRYEERLLRYIHRISNFNQEDSEDALQEVFIKVYRNLNDFNPDLKFSSWIYRITRNHVISSFRKRKSRGIDLTNELNDNVINELIHEFDIKAHLDKKILKNQVGKILDLLDQKYREVLVLKFLEEKNYQEISDILKKPIGTVGTLINRAKKQFQHELETTKINL